MIERSNARGNSHQTSLKIVNVCMQFITVISVTNSKKKKKIVKAISICIKLNL
jgi:hypothetical protein